MRDDTRQLVGGRYQLERSIGVGGMGEVWAAEDLMLGRSVAVKTVDLRGHGDEAAEESLRARVMREARAAARIDHPGSVRVFDVVDEGHTVYLVMELVEAPTLTDVVTERGPLSVAETVVIGLDIVGALAEAHAAGIVHRDVKPTNVMVLPSGHAKLADFGIASVRDDPAITTTGMVLGTPKYMAPEQARGEVAGAAADVWGLGALLYFAVEGVAPFDRGDTLPTLNAIIHDAPRPAVRADGLAALLADLLAKVPNHRPSEDEVARRLAALHPTTRVAAPQPTTVVVAAPATQSLPAPVAAPPGDPTPVPRPVAAHRTPRAALFALALVALLLVGGIAIAAANRGGQASNNAAGTGTSSTSIITTTTTAAPRTTTTAAGRAATADPGRPAGVPGDWVAYQGAGWSIWHPADWQPRPTQGNAIDFVAADGDYLRVDWVAQSSGDPVAAWEAQERAFRASHPSYARIRIEHTSYRGGDAGIWEFTFEGRHAADLGFAVGQRGFALNLVTAADRWDARAGDFDAFKAAFQGS